MRIKLSYLLLFIFMLSGFLAASLSAEEPAVIVPPSDRLYWASLSIIRYNPLGLETQNRIMYSKRLADSTSPLFRDTFIALGPSVKLNPAYVKAGGLLDFQPIGVFNLRLGYEFINYFGTQGYLQSSAVRNTDYDDDLRKDNEDLAYSTKGHHYFAEPTLQMKVSKIAARSKFGFEYWDLDLHKTDKYFYDATLDTMVPTKKVVWTNDSDLIYMSGQLTLGLRYSAVFPGTAQSHMRLGPLFAWSFNTDDYTSFNKPTLLVILGWYLDHPNRIGGVPYALVGFAFSMDFMTAKAPKS
ncbi:MAG: hypothetical protein EPN93_20410 [Spirochaetes bacterium]|nr:MAG: hypothetical protein EPN93_20410 [Spirochaetota bacterium]